MRWFRCVWLVIWDWWEIFSFHARFFFFFFLWHFFLCTCSMIWKKCDLINQSKCQQSFIREKIYSEIKNKPFQWGLASQNSTSIILAEMMLLSSVQEWVPVNPKTSLNFVHLCVVREALMLKTLVSVYIFVSLKEIKN